MADPTWALRMSRDGLQNCGALRLKKIDVCDCGALVWLRSNEALPALQHVLAALPNAERFDVASDGTVLPEGCQVPVARLPKGPWITLAAAITIEPQVALLPACTPPQVDMRVERSTVEREPNMLLATVEAWRDFALTASIHRLKPLKFALAVREACVLVWGIPVPSIPGARIAERSGVAVPCGFELRPINDPDVVRAVLNLADGDVALFRIDGSFEHIEAHHFVPATRSAVRLSLKNERSVLS